MPKAAKRTTSATTPASSKPSINGSQRNSKKGAQVAPEEVLSVEEMMQLGATNREEFGLAKCTREQYARYLQQGKEYLALCIQRRRETMAAAKDGMDDNLLSKAFDKPPNKYSHIALELFLTQKCLRDSEARCGAATGVSIYAAFVWYWDNMDGDRYAGEYKYDEEKEKVSGCPARASDVQSLVKTIRAKPMSIEDLAHIVRWSEAQCPPELLDSPASDSRAQALVTRHAFMRAFMTTAFTLWTRNFELCALHISNISTILKQPPYNLPHFDVMIGNRKGWLRKLNNDGNSREEGSLESRTYKIYEQDIHEIDMYTHLLAWRQHLEMRLGHLPEGNTYLFPFVSSGGDPHVYKPMSYKKAQAQITAFAEESGLHKHFTTHCFRRGGAQYRFMYAPPGDRWCLNMIRWWGGWAENEQTDTLIRYLVNSLQAQENSYDDALNPLRNDPTKSFMGEHCELKKAVTVGEIRVMGTALMDAIQANRAASSTPATMQVELTLSGAITIPSSGDTQPAAAAASTLRMHQQIPYS
ncbi:hypothetical protein F5887DRAFT_1085601 [Amanita rubescens]|nr:hypothetical protein F5887DRAFT_1085601 [Amanita rubescens]